MPQLFYQLHSGIIVLMSKPKIANIKSRMIFDSRGNPTIETDVILQSGEIGRAAVPSGASTGSHEALELRDGGNKFGGLGVNNAIANVVNKIKPSIINLNPTDQDKLDKIMIDIDGTSGKSSLGANAMLSVSLAAAKASAIYTKQPFYTYIATLADNNHKDLKLPIPMVNVINGGKHAEGASDFQEYMIVPSGRGSLNEQLQACSEIFHALKSELSRRHFQTTVGDEGGFAPKLDGGNQAVFELLLSSIEHAKYNAGKDILLGLDVAASEFYADKKYNLASENRILQSHELSQYYGQLTNDFPIFSIEDPFAENDFEAWEKFTTDYSSAIQIVGDDLLVTNPALINESIRLQRANSLLVKPNQVGTLTETIEATKLAKKAGWTTIMSHRSGETEDTTIAHLAVGLQTDYIKSGSMSRSERLAKYNELLRISEQINDK